MTITTRSGKGSALTWAEEDSNFVELDARTTEGWQMLVGEISTDGLSNPPSKVLYKGIVQLDSFDPDNIQELAVVFHIPKDYVAGSDFYPHGHFHSSTTSAGTVRWGFSLTWANPYHLADFGREPFTEEKFVSPVTGYVEATLDASHQDANNVAESVVPFSIPYLLPGAIIFMRVFRDATHINDTYPGSIFMTSVALAYRSQGFGGTEV